MTNLAGARALGALLLSCPIALLSCGPSRPPVVEVNLSATVAPAPSQEPAPRDDSKMTSGCSWSDKTIHAREGDLPLCFENQGACFATARSPFRGETTIWLPPGEPAKTGGRLKLIADGIRLEVWTAGDQVVLYPKEPVVLGEVAISKEASLVHVARLTDRILELRLQPERSIVPHDNALTARVSCSAVGLDRVWYSEEAIRAAIGGGQSSVGARTLVSGRPLAISASATGPVKAVVTPEDSDVQAELLAETAERSRILWWRGDLVIFGWVDTALLGPPPVDPPGGVGYGSGSGRLGKGERPGTRCPNDVPLFAQVHDARQKVGAIEKGTVFNTDGATEDGAFVSVLLRASQIRLAKSSVFLVEQAALKQCEEQ